MTAVCPAIRRMDEVKISSRGLFVLLQLILINSTVVAVNRVRQLIAIALHLTKIPHHVGQNNESRRLQRQAGRQHPGPASAKDHRSHRSYRESAVFCTLWKVSLCKTFRDVAANVPVNFMSSAATNHPRLTS